MNPSIPLLARLFHRRPLAVCLLAGAILAPIAQGKPEASLFGPARFFIEAVRVEGAIDVPVEIVVSESRLEDGGFYSEDDLRQAVDRVRRLPFILDADLALERGSERGKLRLVIAVEEVRRFFFGGEAVATRFGRDLALDEAPSRDGSIRVAPLAGRRFFAGRYGVFFAAVGEGPSAVAGYTRYRLFGRPALLNLELRRAGDGDLSVPPLALDPSFSSWTSDEVAESGTLTLGLPLGNGDRFLRFVAAISTSDGGRRQTAIDEPGPELAFHHAGSSDRRLELAWISDTRNDPLFPTRGSRLAMALQRRTFAADSVQASSFDPESALTMTAVDPDMRSRLLRAAVTGERHWPLGGRHSLSLTVRAALGRSRVVDVPVELGEAGVSLLTEDLDVVEGSVSVRHALKVWESPRDHPAQEIYWENTVHVGHEEVSPDAGLLQSPLNTWSFTSAVTWRSVWGIFRLGLAYIDAGRTL